MKTVVKNALVYRNDTRDFRELDILCEDGVIKALAECGTLDTSDAQVIDADNMAVLPALIDVHTHGRAGYDFVSCDKDALGVMARDYAAHGVATVMPTLASAPYGEMLEAAKNIGEFKPNENEASYCGVHIEGRYLNVAKRGAHAAELLSSLEASELEDKVWRELDSLHISAAYELDLDGSFARKALEIGATLSLGHTAATYAQAIEAEKMGVSAYTHLFNAMPALHHREGGAVCACLTGDAYAELICDGIHVAPEMIRLVYRCKGADKLALISDSMEATGCPDGDYSIAGNPVKVTNGKALTLDGALAGSTLTLDEAVRNLMEFCNIPLTDAILCATESPAKEVGIFDKCGSIDIGKRADLLFVDNTDAFSIKKIMIRGNFND